MKLADLLSSLKEPDHLDGEVLQDNTEVVFHTSVRFDMDVLSVYYEEGKIHIDID